MHIAALSFRIELVIPYCSPRRSFFRCHLAALPKYTYDIRCSRRQCASDSLRSEEAGAEGFRSLYECLGTSILGYSAANDVLGV